MTPRVFLLALASASAAALRGRWTPASSLPVTVDETLGATLVLGGCDRKRCFHDGWLLRVWTKRAPREVRNGVIVATADDEHEVAWEPLLAGGAAHAPSAAQRHSCAVHPRLEWLHQRDAGKRLAFAQQMMETGRVPPVELLKEGETVAQ